MEHMTTLLSNITAEDVEFESWQRVVCKDGKNRMRIVKTTQKLTDFIATMTKQYDLFLQHVERVRHQYRSIAELKANLPMNEVVIQMDFAENFACQSADEIQSAYWDSTNVTLYPVVAHQKSPSGELEHKNYVFKSDVNHHNSRAVVAIIQKLVPLVKTDFPKVTKMHYWTDSPTSQYRNRYIFDILCRHEDMFGVKAVWNYFESGHGNGPCDGIGGSAKRQASDAVKQGKVSIQDASEFYEWASLHEKKIKYIFYTQEEYDAADALIRERNTDPIPGTMRLHAVVPADRSSLYTRDVSCYCFRCLTGSLCESWSKYQLTTNQQAATVEPLEVHEPIETTEVVDAGTAIDMEFEPPEIGTYIAAVYNKKWFIGQVIDVDVKDSDIFVNSMADVVTKKGVTYKWPNPSDDLWVPFNKVICNIVPPTAIDRSKRSFVIADGTRELIEAKFALIKK